MSAKIIKGDDVSLTISLKDSNGECFDLTPYADASDAITVCLEGTSSNVSTTGTISGAPESGKILFSLDNTETDSLKTGKISVEAILDNELHPAGARRTSQMKNALEVLERICS